MKHDSIIKNGTVVFPFHGKVKCDIGIKDGKIAAIADEIDANLGEEIVDANGKYVFPAAVDSHYHVGIYRPQSEDAESESRTALVGGVGTIIRGKVMFDNRKVTEEKRGEFIKRPTALHG